MSIITHNLLPKQKEETKVTLYTAAESLYDGLEEAEIVNRMKEVPQLGLIHAPKRLMRTRYDYVFLQLYFHQLINTELKRQLKFSYNNRLSSKELSGDDKCLSECNATIGEILQCLVIAYNIGHFFDTFTASRAVVMLAGKDEGFASSIKNQMADPQFKEAADKIFSEHNYKQLHLLNSLMILERCNPSTQSIRESRRPLAQAIGMTKEVIYAYLRGTDLSDKMEYVFKVFKIVRNVAYVAYDLQVANIPFTLDILNKDAVVSFFKELLSEFNDNSSSQGLVTSLQKLLDDALYNKIEDTICYYQLSKTMCRKAKSDHSGGWPDYYEHYFGDPASVFNRPYSIYRDYDRDNLLKITFQDDTDKVQDNTNIVLAEHLIDELDRTEYVRVGYYDRGKSAKTVVASVSRNCTDKIFVSFQILRSSIKYIRQISQRGKNKTVKDKAMASPVEPDDNRYILVTKYFLRCLFGNRTVIISPTISDTVCVLCTRGSRSRIDQLQKLIDNGVGTKDDIHEVEAMQDILQGDEKNDICITVPGSTVVYEGNDKLCEFDGIIIFPNRKRDQIIILEAKNTRHKRYYGEKCLREKLDKLKISYTADSIFTKDKGHDAYFTMSIGDTGMTQG